MKTVLFGSAGQLGRDLAPLLPGEVVALTRAEADLTDPTSVRTCLERHRPDLVVNCAAYNLVDKAEADPADAFAVNARGARTIADACRDLGATLLHFSTDYVFGLDADRRTPWKETDAPGPVSAYGLSKLVGEYWVRQACPKHFVVRTCGLYGVWGTGGKGGNFVETMLRVAGQGKPLRVVNDQRCTPSFTTDIARASAALVHTKMYGLYHVTNAGYCTWFEFAREIFRQAGVTASLAPITSEEYGAAARRPAFSVLSNEKLIAADVPTTRSWPEALADYLQLRAGRR
jgi:dTDP-4-dehydrorhamnose reductase